MSECNKRLLTEHIHQAREGLITALAVSQALQSSQGRDTFLSAEVRTATVSQIKMDQLSQCQRCFIHLNASLCSPRLHWQTVKPSTFYRDLTAVQLSALQYCSSQTLRLCLVWIALGNIVHNTSYLGDGFMRWKATMSSPGEPADRFRPNNVTSLMAT